MQEFLTRKEAAEFLGVKASTLTQWAYTHEKKLAYYKVGKTCQYKMQDLIDYRESRRVDPRGGA